MIVIQHLSIDISPFKTTPRVKPTPSNSSGLETFISKAPKMTKSSAFKPLEVVKPNTNDLVSCAMLNM